MLILSYILLLMLIVFAFTNVWSGLALIGTLYCVIFATPYYTVKSIALYKKDARVTKDWFILAYPALTLFTIAFSYFYYG